VVDLEFARSCAQTILATHGAEAEEFVRGKTNDPELCGALRDSPSSSS
jgi:hypothetical protein